MKPTKIAIYPNFIGKRITNRKRLIIGTLVCDAIIQKISPKDLNPIYPLIITIRATRSNE